MAGFGFATEVRVRFAETDAQGIAHNSNYFVWFEVARVAYLERHAGGYQLLRDAGIEAVVLETHVRYLAPARFDDRLRRARTLRRRAEARGSATSTAIERAGDAIADGWTAHATVDAGTFRPTRVPTWLREAIASAEATEPSS